MFFIFHNFQLYLRFSVFTGAFHDDQLTSTEFMSSEKLKRMRFFTMYENELLHLLKASKQIELQTNIAKKM